MIRSTRFTLALCSVLALGSGGAGCASEPGVSFLSGERPALWHRLPSGVFSPTDLSGDEYSRAWRAVRRVEMDALRHVVALPHSYTNVGPGLRYGVPDSARWETVQAFYDSLLVPQGFIRDPSVQMVSETAEVGVWVFDGWENPDGAVVVLMTTTRWPSRGAVDKIVSLP